MNGSSVEVTGGLGAFLALFFLAGAVIFLGYDLSRRLRRLDQQERLRVEEERLKRAGRVQEPGGASDRGMRDGGATDGGASDPDVGGPAGSGGREPE